MSAVTMQGALESRIPTGRIIRAGAIAAVLAAVANTIVRVLAVTLQTVDPAFGPLGWVPPALFSVVGALGATIVFWTISRLSQRPANVFTRIAVVVLPLSLIPDLMLLLPNGPIQMPGATVWSVGALIVMHLVAAAIIVPTLTRSARRNV